MGIELWFCHLLVSGSHGFTTICIKNCNPSIAIQRYEFPLCQLSYCGIKDYLKLLTHIPFLKPLIHACCLHQNSLQFEPHKLLASWICPYQYQCTLDHKEVRISLFWSNYFPKGITHSAAQKTILATACLHCFSQSN